MKLKCMDGLCTRSSVEGIGSIVEVYCQMVAFLGHLECTGHR